MNQNKSGSNPQPVETQKRKAGSRFTSSSEQQDAAIRRVLHQLEGQLPELRGKSYDRATRSLTLLARGNKVDYRTPVYGKWSGKKLVLPPRSQIVEILDAAIKVDKTRDDFSQVLDDIETEERGRIGPQSMFLPFAEDGPEKADAVYSNKEYPQDCDMGALQRALDRVQALIPSQSIEMISITDAVHGFGGTEDPRLANDGMDTSTNSGLPFMKSGWVPKTTMKHADYQEAEAIYKFEMDMASTLVSELKTKVESLPYFYAVSFQRMVQRGPKPYGAKSKRLVIGFPKHEAIAGNTVGRPLTQKVKELKSPSGNLIFAGFQSLAVIDREMQKILADADSNGWTVVSGDVSGMDASLIPDLMVRIGKIVGSWIRGGEHFVAQLVEMMVNRTWLLTPTKLYKPQPSSNKSGSWFTTLMNCFYLLTALFYGEEVRLYTLRSYTVQGDDSAAAGRNVTPDTIAEAFRQCGLTANAEKQFYKPKSLHFLQRLHYLGRPGGVYSVYRALGHALSLERFEFRPGDWTGATYSVRMLAQIQNCAFNPRVSQLTYILRDGDKYRLGADYANAQEFLIGAGSVADTIARTGSTDLKDWRGTENALSFGNWVPNGILRGEELPPAGEALFKRVYGEAA
jgi:hypothetical protein